MIVTSRVLAQAMHQHHYTARGHAFGRGQSCSARLFPSLAVNVESVDLGRWQGFMKATNDRLGCNTGATLRRTNGRPLATGAAKSLGP